MVGAGDLLRIGRQPVNSPDFAGVYGDWTNPAAFSRIRLRERFQEPRDSSVSIGKSVSMALDSHKLPCRIWENKRKPENPLVLPGEHRHAGSSATNSRHDRLLVRLQPAAHATAYRARNPKTSHSVSRTPRRRPRMPAGSPQSGNAPAIAADYVHQQNDPHRGSTVGVILLVYVVSRDSRGIPGLG